ncbi:MAG TPA: DUF2971 domain-containing protein, partial [Candidatus Hydrogenedentes bacterium]|nr:DUF2971 domain-containing protein [Candidatus Hydrogenedentota bacterium]
MSIRLDPRLQTLSAQLQEVALKPLLEGPHTIEGTLYHHYTSALGGLKILESGDLWATNIDFLNDPDETQYGERFCLRFLQNVIEEYRPVDNEFVTLLDGIQKVIWQFAEDIFPHELQFLTSFSLEGDLLSQWRAYADNGKGLSLGFSNTEILYRLVENFAEGDETKVPRPIPHLVLYEKSEQEALLRNVVNALYDAWPALKTDFYKNDEINKGLKSIGALKFATATMCFK